MPQRLLRQSPRVRRPSECVAEDPVWRRVIQDSYAVVRLTPAQGATSAAFFRVRGTTARNRSAFVWATRHATKGGCPGGTNDRSQAIYCLVSIRKREPSRRYGVIGSDMRATIRTTNQPGIRIRPSLRDGFSIERVPGNKLPGYDHLVPPGQSPVSPYGTK